MQVSIRCFILTVLLVILAMMNFRAIYERKRQETINSTQFERINQLEDKIEQYRREQDALIYYYTTEQWK